MQYQIHTHTKDLTYGHAVGQTVVIHTATLQHTATTYLMAHLCHVFFIDLEVFSTPFNVLFLSSTGTTCCIEESC